MKQNRITRLSKAGLRRYPPVKKYTNVSVTFRARLEFPIIPTKYRTRNEIIATSPYSRWSLTNGHTPPAEGGIEPEQLCYFNGHRPEADYLLKMCVREDQFYLDWNRAMWPTVSAATQRTCASMIIPTGYGANKPLYDCLVMYGSMDAQRNAPMQVR